jgi:hypothetical protein
MSSKKSKKTSLTRGIRYDNALKSAGFQDNYRYYFRIKEARADGTTEQSDPTNASQTSSFKKEDNTGAIIIKEVQAWADPGTESIIALDIPPSAVTITSPFAISVIATNKGILEEHNGLVFKTIVISGNTGILPRDRQGALSGKAKNTWLSNYLPETGASVNKLVGSIKKLVNPSNSDIPSEADYNRFATNPSTGYAKFWRLHNFLVSYADAKKSGRWKNARLVFGCPKDNIEYVCTPIQFEMKRDASRPLTYNYMIVLKAWELTKPFFPAIKDLQIPSPRNPGAIKDLANSVMSARDVIQNGRNVLLGVNNDIQSVLNVASQVIFFTKDLAGLATDILDFPTLFLNNIDQMIVGSWEQMAAAMETAFQSGDERLKRVLGGVRPFDNSASEAVGAGSSVASAQSNSPTGTSFDPKTSQSTPAKLSAESFARYALQNSAIGSSINLDSIALPDNLKQDLESQKEEARNITTGDIRDLQADLQNTSDNLAQSIGLMDEAYATTYGLPPPDLGRAPTEDDIILMASLQEQKDGFGSLLSTGELLKEASADPFVSANNNLPEDDAINAPPSAFLTRINNGENLQDVAGRTLGDSSRWREIAILNDLKPPYVTSQLLSKTFTAPFGRTVLVSDASDLAIGEYVTIFATSSTRRKILNIENFDSSFRITFDGPDNLSAFVSSPVKNLLYAQAGTVVSGDPILIPSAGEAEDLSTLRPTPLNSRLSNAEKIFKIDLAVNDSGDFILSGDGDIKRSYGYDNAIQAIKLALSVEKGELERHPSYGVGIPIGSRNSDLGVNQLDNLVREQITSDPRFTDVDTQVKVNGSEVRIEVLARGAESTGLIPIEFRVGDPE